MILYTAGADAGFCNRGVLFCNTGKFGGTVQYRHMHIRMEEILAEFTLPTGWLVCQIATFSGLYGSGYK